MIFFISYGPVTIQCQSQTTISHAIRLIDLYFSECFDHEINKKPFGTILINTPETRVDLGYRDRMLAVKSNKKIPKNQLLVLSKYEGPQKLASWVRKKMKKKITENKLGLSCAKLRSS